MKSISEDEFFERYKIKSIKKVEMALSDDGKAEYLIKMGDGTAFLMIPIRGNKSARVRSAEIVENGDGFRIGDMLFRLVFNKDLEEFIARVSKTAKVEETMYVI